MALITKTINSLPEIPSEFIEPYLEQFMGSMIEYLAYARDDDEKRIGFTVNEIKDRIRGVELFVSQTCGIHARYAMMNEMQRFCNMPNDELKKLCKQIVDEVII